MGGDDVEAAGDVVRAELGDDGVEMFDVVGVKVADAIEEAVVSGLLSDEGGGVAEGAYGYTPGIVGEVTQGGEFFDPEGDAG